MVNGQGHCNRRQETHAPLSGRGDVGHRALLVVSRSGQADRQVQQTEDDQRKTSKRSGGLCFVEERSDDEGECDDGQSVDEEDEEDEEDVGGGQELTELGQQRTHQGDDENDDGVSQDPGNPERD